MSESVEQAAPRLYDLRFHRHFAVVDRRTDRTVYSVHARDAFTMAKTWADTSPLTGYLSVVPMVNDGRRFAR